MPRSTRTSSTASDGAASSSAAGGGEETTDGAKKRQKVTAQDKDQLRELMRRFSQDMYAMAVAYLMNALESRQDGGQGRLLVASPLWPASRSRIAITWPAFAMTNAKTSAPRGAAPSSTHQ